MSTTKTIDVPRFEAREFDPVSLEILWARLISIADQAAATLVRTSFSTVVREANDYACGLMDADGTALVENSYAIPGFIRAMPMATRHFLTVFPRRSWHPEDAVITNDPWRGAGHLPDIVMATPVFYRGNLVAFATSIAHAPDIGGSVWSIEGREIFEEGLRIPPTKLFRRGKPNTDLVDLIRANVRVPDQVMGDLHAARAAAATAAQKLAELLEEQELSDLGALGSAMQRRSEAAMRQAIERIPDGTYGGFAEMDGFEDALQITATIRVRGDELEVDYSGTSDQVSRAINCPEVNTFAHTTYALKCLLDPLTPRNDGSYIPIRVIAPMGSLVNPRFPAPVAARQIVVLYLNSVIFHALADVLPDRVIADSGTPHMQVVYSGIDRRGKPYVLIPFDAAGMGARPTKDGLSATPYPTNAGATSVEVMESGAPLLFHRKAFATDSGGPGKYRGGLGQEIFVEFLSSEPTVLSVIGDRIRHPARGILGGLPGAPARIRRRAGGKISEKGRNAVQRGEVIEIRSAGGGGYGLPSERDPDLIRRDLERGLVSPSRTKRMYPAQWMSIRRSAHKGNKGQRS